ncbi:MAG: HAD family hydrolase [Microgenomates group bacterium]
MVKALEWIFDLDDTLYSEREYVQSALSFVGTLTDELFATDRSAQTLQSLWEAGDTDAIGTLWQRESLPQPAKESILAAMRAHRPQIKLRSGASELLNVLRKNGTGFSVMTDGRSITQRAKLAALGCLDARTILISQESGWQKPDPRCYQYFETKFQNREFIYIGDNLSKDFVTANKHGWTTVMLADDGTHIHRQESSVTEEYRADFVVKNLSELMGISIVSH